MDTPPINQSTDQATMQPCDQTTSQSTNERDNRQSKHATKQPSNQKKHFRQSISHTANQPTNQPTNQPSNQVTNQPINQITSQPHLSWAKYLIYCITTTTIIRYGVISWQDSHYTHFNPNLCYASKVNIFAIFMLFMSSKCRAAMPAVWRRVVMPPIMRIPLTQSKCSWRVGK